MAGPLRTVRSSIRHKALVSGVGLLLLLPALGCGKDQEPKSGKSVATPRPSTAGPWAERRRAEVAAARTSLSVELGEDGGVDVQSAKEGRTRFDPVITKDREETPLRRWGAFARKWLSEASRADTKTAPLEIVELTFPPTTSWWGGVLSLVAPLRDHPRRNLVVRLRSGSATAESPSGPTVDLRLPEDKMRTEPPFEASRLFFVTLDAAVERGLVHRVEVRTISPPTPDATVRDLRIVDLGNLEPRTLDRLARELTERSRGGGLRSVQDRFAFVLSSHEPFVLPQLEAVDVENEVEDAPLFSGEQPRRSEVRPGGKDWLTAGRVMPVLALLRRIADECGGTLHAFQD